MPLLGHLFKRTETRRSKTDLVILLTPTILGPASVAENTARELRRLDEAKAAVRFSLSRYTTAHEIDAAASALERVVFRMRGG